MKGDVQTPISDIEREIIAFFVNAAQSIGLPKSYGEIYGLFFASEHPLALDDVINKLHISKGSASQGIRFLKSINALNPIYLPGDRRDHFAPETSLRKLANGFLRERIIPELRLGTERLASIQETIPEDDFVTHERIQSIQAWTKKADLIFPVVSKFLGATTTKRDISN